MDGISEKTETVLQMVLKERSRQFFIWGDQSQNHPFEWAAILGEEFGELCEAINETCFHRINHPERGGCDAIIREAIHVAAVAVAIVEAQISNGGDHT